MSQLPGVFVIAVVACGGRGGDEPPAVDDGTTDVSETATPAAVDDDIDTPQPIPPVPIDARGVHTAPTNDPDTVDDGAARQPSDERWRARAPERYVIRTCGFGAAPPSCTVEAVDEGRLVSRSTRFLPDEPWATAPIDDGTEPVTSLFEYARRSSADCTTSYELDPVYAYPSQIYNDCGQEGSGVRVTCFEPDTLDASLCQ